MRFVLILLALTLAALLNLQRGSAEDPPTETPTVDEPLPDEIEEQPAEPPIEPEPPPDQRARPLTEAEEDNYKRKAVLDDPYLNAPAGPPAGALAFYRPLDWLRFDVQYDRSTYLVQDASGKLEGLLTINAEPLVDSFASYIHLELDYAAPKKRVEMWIDSKTLKPRNVIKFTPPATTPVAPVEPVKGTQKSKATPRLPVQPELGDVTADIEEPAAQVTERRTEVEYLFDRVTISRSVGVVATQERMRQLPYSFDIEQLPLLVRQLDFSRLEKQWPFEALVTDPEHRISLPLQIDRPKHTDVVTAEPQTRSSYELKMRLGEQVTWTLWVERKTPYRLLKFTDGVYTYNLHQYDPAPGSY
ncbi:MAG: hypothetical protein M3R04_01525 [bacterium]|nr:hypothetical protein [bacterium]